MASPITWRNVYGPSLAEASRPLEGAQRSFDNAFTGLSGLVKQQETVDQSNWNQVKENNTQDFLNKLYSAQGAEGFKALQDSGQLEQMLAANGAQIDRAAARSAMDGRLTTLQNRDLQGITYKNTMLDDAQANDVRRINTLALTDPAAASAELAKNPDLRKSFEIAKNIDASAQTQVERERAKTRFGFDMNEEQRKAAEEAQRALLRPIAVQQAQAGVGQTLASTQSSLASAAASRENVLTSQANRERIEAEAEKARSLQKLGVALDGNIYKEGVYKAGDTEGLAKIMKDYAIGGKDEDAGSVRANIVTRLNKLAQNGIEIEILGQDGKKQKKSIPIPLGVVKAALLSASDPIGPSNFGNTFEQSLKSQLQGIYAQQQPQQQGGFKPPPAMDPMGIMPGLRQNAQPPAGNKALDDWLAYEAIMRGKAEIPPAATARKK